MQLFRCFVREDNRHTRANESPNVVVLKEDDLASDRELSEHLPSRASSTTTTVRTPSKASRIHPSLGVAARQQQPQPGPTGPPTSSPEPPCTTLTLATAVQAAASVSSVTPAFSYPEVQVLEDLLMGYPSNHDTPAPPMAHAPPTALRPGSVGGVAPAAPRSPRSPLSRPLAPVVPGTAPAGPLCYELVDQSPFCMTAVALDGSMLHQSPLSVSYYGNLSSSFSAGAALRPELHLQLLRALFRLEGESLLLEVLQEVLGVPVEQPGGGAGWRRVMRVPATCPLKAGDAVGSAGPSPAAAMSQRSLFNQASGHSLDAARGPRSVSRPAMMLGLPANRGPGDAASGVRWAGSSEQGDEANCWGATHEPAAGPQSAGLELQAASSSNSRGLPQGASNSSSRRLSSTALPEVPEGDISTFEEANRSSSLTDKASAVSVAVRNAPRRMKSLLDLSLVSKQPPANQLQQPTTNSLSMEQSKPVRAPWTPSEELSRSVRSASHLNPNPIAPASEALKQSRFTVSHVAKKGSEEDLDRLGDDVEALSLEASSPTLGGAWLPEAGQQQQELGERTGGGSAGTEGAGQVPADTEQWHEVFLQATKTADGRQLLLIYQSNVTVRTQVETAMARLTEMQLDTLCQIFPRHIIEFMSSERHESSPANLGLLARSHQDVSILFMDIVGFTSMSKQVAPDAVMTFLNSLFSIFDDLCAAHDVHKVETAGDCYIASSGMLAVDAEGFAQVTQDHDPEESTAKMFEFAKDMLAASREVLMPHDSSPVTIRIGIHTGPCVSGVVGSKLPKFGVFGDTMNTASRMESTCTPGCIQVSSFTHALLMASGQSSSQEWEAVGGIEVKGKGIMETFKWREPQLQPSAPGIQDSTNSGARPKPGGPADRRRARRASAQSPVDHGAMLMQILHQCPGPEQVSGQAGGGTGADAGVQRPTLTSGQLEGVFVEEPSAAAAAKQHPWTQAAKDRTLAASSGLRLKLLGLSAAPLATLGGGEGTGGSRPPQQLAQGALSNIMLSNLERWAAAGAGIAAPAAPGAPAHAPAVHAVHAVPAPRSAQE